jgi:BirA family biotin operon repressor/biotin-[acetyl-CoA-carboxylase] ligase
MTDLDAQTILTAFQRADLPEPRFRGFETIASTNDAALAWLAEAEAPPDLAFVVASQQTRGRGRMGRTWVTSAAGALTVSFILHPPAPALTRLPLLGALAVCTALADFDVSAAIKWPNDVQLDGLKIAGVLAEASWIGDVLRGAVVGIGVNLNEDFTGTPLAATAGSVTSLTGRAIGRAELLAALYRHLAHWFARIDDAAFFEAWRARLNMIGQPVRVTHGPDGSGLIEGLAEAVDRDGALIVRLADGRAQRLIAGDVTRLA